MNKPWRTLTYCLAISACTSSSGREPADQSDAAQQTRDAAADASRDATTANDARVPGKDASTDVDASEQADAGTDAGMTRRNLETFVYIGGYDRSGANYPVKTFELNRMNGELGTVNTGTTFGTNPSFIAVNKEGTRLYMTNEDGDPKAGVTVASLDPSTGYPSMLDRRADTGGQGLVHASIAPDGKFLLAADYNAGRLVNFPIGSDGKLGAGTNITSFGGTANTHSSGFRPDEGFAYSPNKGLNIIAQFSVDAATSKISRLADFKTDGNGPRMIAIASSGKFAYVVFELSSTVEAYSIGDNGLLTKIDQESIQPSGFSGQKWGAHAALHPNGKFLYTSDRGSNTIAVFAVGDDGKLSHLADPSSEGKVPRCFAIDSEGQYLVVANEGDDDNSSVGNLVAFEIGDDGMLSKRGTVIDLKAPTAVVMITREE